DAIGLLAPHPGVQGQLAGKMGDTLGVTEGVAVLGVNGRRQGLHGAHEQVVLVLVDGHVVREGVDVAGGGLDELDVVAAPGRIATQVKLNVANGRSQTKLRNCSGRYGSRIERPTEYSRSIVSYESVSWAVNPRRAACGSSMVSRSVPAVARQRAATSAAAP